MFESTSLPLIQKLNSQLLFRRALSVVTALVFCLVTSSAFAEEPDEIYDPIEPVNRGIFWFNDHLYTYLLRPISIGYDTVVPDPVQTGVHNFFQNLRYPIYLVSDLIQLKFEQAGDHTGRFLVNSTVGLLGLIDVAKDMGLKHHEEDFGTGLGYDGVSTGPYIVLPILGPSNLRDAFGRAVDGFLNPTYYVYYYDVDGSTQVAVSMGSRALEAVDGVNRERDNIDSAKDSSLDYYRFVRSAYTKYRQNVVYDNHPPKIAGSTDESEPNFDPPSKDK